MSDWIYRVLFSFCLVSILIIAGCRIKKSDTRVIKVGISHGPTHSFTQAMERFGQMLEETSDGRFRVVIYNSARIGSEKEMQEMLTLGTLEITVTGLLNNYEPLFAVFELPYLYRDREHVKRVNDDKVMQDLAQSLLPKGLHLIGFYENGFRHITNNKQPINRPGDLSGLMIRTPENPAQVETFRAFGAIPTPLSFSELYTALMQGVVDGQENPLQNIWFGRFFEVQQYVAKTAHIYNSAYALISERFWTTLETADQRLILDSVEASSDWQLAYMKNLDAELEQRLKDEGMQFTYPDHSAFREAALPAYEALYSRLGPRAREMVEQIKALE